MAATTPGPDLQQLIAELIRKHLADAPNSPEAMDALAADLTERVEQLRAGILANRERAFNAEAERDWLIAVLTQARDLGEPQDAHVILIDEALAAARRRRAST